MKVVRYLTPEEIKPIWEEAFRIEQAAYEKVMKGEEHSLELRRQAQAKLDERFKSAVIEAFSEYKVFPEVHRGSILGFPSGGNEPRVSVLLCTREDEVTE
jgi:hypothetical protein